MKQWQFQQDVKLYELQTTVRSCSLVQPNLYGVVLDDTIFSPEGDTGTMNDQQVQSVSMENDDIVHYVDTYVTPGSVVTLRINEQQRRHLIAHTTARLLLGIAITEISKTHIVASGVTEMGGYIELKREFINPSEVRKMIHMVHRMIASDFAIKVFSVHYSQAVEIYRKHRVYLEETKDPVLLTEVEKLGVLPYMGMVATSTGMLGCLVLEGVTRPNGRVRISYTAGDLARQRVVEQAVLVDKVTRHLGVSEKQVMDTLKKRQEEFSTIASEYSKSFQEFLRQELEKIDEHAPVAVNFYKEISQENLRLFSDKAIARFPDKIFIFFSQEGEQLHYVCRGPQDSRYDMQQLSQFIARCIQGRGEGTANIAEGSGAGALEENELVHLCATFLQNYRLNRPRSVARRALTEASSYDAGVGSEVPYTF